MFLWNTCTEYIFNFHGLVSLVCSSCYVIEHFYLEGTENPAFEMTENNLANGENKQENGEIQQQDASNKSSPEDVNVEVVPEKNR